MNWWSRVWRRKQMEDQLAKELRFHLDHHAADLIARGQTPQEALRHAHLALGGPEQVKEKCRDARGTRWLEDLLQDTRYALRTFRQKPGFAAVALLILALGIGSTTLMFTVINGVLLKPLAFPEPQQLVTLRGFTKDFGEFWGFSNLDFSDLQSAARSFSLSAWRYGGGTISRPGEPEYIDGRKISANLFSTLGIPLLQGRAFLPGEDRPGAAPVAIISSALWQRRYSDNPSAVGSTLIFEGLPYTIVGIAPPGLQLSGDTDILTPLEQDPDPRMQIRAARFLRVIGRRNPGVAMPAAESELALIARRLAEQFPASDSGVGMRAYPLQQGIVGDVGGTLWLLLTAVGLVLLIVCVNIASLLLARAVSRERELAMRVALGAGRGRLIRQCLAESAVLGLSGGILGLLIAAVGLRPFVAFWPGSLPRAAEIHVDWRILLFAIGVSLASGALFGLAPALRVPFRNLEHALRSGGRAISGSSHRLHGVFVASEIALAFILLASAGMLGHTLLQLSSLDPGLNVHNVLTARFALSPASVTTPDRIRAAWQGVLDQARRVPGLQSAALADIIPMREGENSLPYSTTPTPPTNASPWALSSTVSPGYLAVMQIPLRQGRFIDDQDRINTAPVVVIDENLARHAFGDQAADAVGRRLWIPALSANPIQVVGVVGHVRHWGLAGDDQSKVHDQLYYPFAQVPDRSLHFFSTIMSIAVRTSGDPASMVEPLRRELRGAARDQALYDENTMEQLVKASLDLQRFLLLLFGIFAAIALLLACVGIYGVLAYLTGQRVPEFGVRIALGATTRDVMRLVLRQSLGMIFVGTVAGIVVAAAAGRVLLRLVAGMRPAEASTFAIMAPLLIAAALLASFIPARRASRVDPVVALRQD